MSIRSDVERAALSAFLHEKVGQYKFEPSVYRYGVVQSAKDDVITIHGLSGCRYGEILQFDNDVYGLALDLSEDTIGAALLNADAFVAAGSVARGTGKAADICVGDAVIGRVVDPLGRPLDGMPLSTIETRRVENRAPRIVDRAPVKRPLETGILAVDSMIPIAAGKGNLSSATGKRAKPQSPFPPSAPNATTA